jgi:hypothetical protein
MWTVAENAKKKVAEVVALYGDCSPDKVSVNTIVRDVLVQTLGLSKSDADRVVKTVNSTRVCVSRTRKDAKIAAMAAELAELRKAS